MRFALRQLLKHRGFTAIAVLTLALGIGGNTAMFSIVNALLFRPLNLPRPAELARVYSPHKSMPDQHRGVSYPNYVDLRREDRAFAQLAAFVSFQVSIAEGDSARQAFVDAVSANYFAALGAGLNQGRPFTEEEERDGGQPPVVIVSHRFWHSRGAAPDFVGRTLHIAGKPHTVIGIAQPGFLGHSALMGSEFWLPLCRSALAWRCNEADLAGNRKKLQVLNLVGRLKPGVSFTEANSQMAVLAEQLRTAYPGENDDFDLTIGPLPRISAGYGPASTAVFGGLSVVLMSLSGIVLLVAGWNVANLLLARAATRRQEMAVRFALGSGRGRIVRQLLLEGLLLSVLGGAAGLVVAFGLSRLLLTGATVFLPGFSLAFGATLDWRVLLATLGICVFATLAFALSPAWAVARAIGLSDLRDQAGGADLRVAGLGVFSSRSWRVVGQLALCLALLTVAALILRSVQSTLEGEAGFPLENRLVLELSPGLENRDVKTYPALFASVETRLRSIPGVDAVGSSISIPFSMSSARARVRPAEGSLSADRDDSSTDAKEVQDTVLDYVTPEYFQALGLPFRRGRTFEPFETPTGDPSSPARVAVVDELLAAALWPGRDPVGQHLEAVGFTRDRKSEFLRVIGLVPAIRQHLTESRPVPHLYLPMNPASGFGVRYFVVKTAARPAGGDAGMVREIWRKLRDGPDPAPLMSVKTMSAHRDENPNLVATRGIARLLLGFGLLAAALSVSGIYGVTAYTVACRTREFGIRLALGSSHKGILWLVLRQGLAQTGLGVAVGLALAWGLTKLLGTEFHALRTFDPIVFAGVPLALGLVVVLACSLPARRATRVDPAVALRSE